MEAVQQDTRTFDGPTIGAALTTLVFALLAGSLLSYMPETGGLGGALDALKNVVYVLTVPFFDITRRLLSRRKNALQATAQGAGPNLLTVAFVSALVLFIIIEALSALMGFGVGALCGTIGQSTQEVPVANCVHLGINLMSISMLIPIFVALGLGCGWIWQKNLGQGLWKTLLLFVIALLILFALDFFLVLESAESEGTKLYVQQLRDNPLLTIGGKAIILAPSILIGYGAAKAWNGLARAFG
jgi:hypothetical protein